MDFMKASTAVFLLCEMVSDKQYLQFSLSDDHMTIKIIINAIVVGYIVPFKSREVKYLILQICMHYEFHTTMAIVLDWLKWRALREVEMTSAAYNSYPLPLGYSILYTLTAVEKHWLSVRTPVFIWQYAIIFSPTVKTNVNCWIEANKYFKLLNVIWSNLHVQLLFSIQKTAVSVNTSHAVTVNVNFSR